jgi:hypothetical protein
MELHNKMYDLTLYRNSSVTNKVTLVKALRNVFDIPLRESKQIVDTYMDRGTIVLHTFRLSAARTAHASAVIAVGGSGVYSPEGQRIFDIHSLEEVDTPAQLIVLDMLPLGTE